MFGLGYGISEIDFKNEWDKLETEKNDLFQLFRSSIHILKKRRDRTIHKVNIQIETTIGPCGCPPGFKITMHGIEPYTLYEKLPTNLKRIYQYTELSKLYCDFLKYLKSVEPTYRLQSINGTDLYFSNDGAWDYIESVPNPKKQCVYYHNLPPYLLNSNFKIHIEIYVC